MLFKLSPWEFFSKAESFFTSDDSGVFAFLCTDPYLERFLISHIKKNSTDFNLVFGQEVDHRYVEEKIFALTLFNQNENFLILKGEEIDNLVLEQLFFCNQGVDYDYGGQKIVVIFSKKSKAYLELSKKLNQEDKIKNFVIEEVKFWESSKLWQLSMQLKKVTYKNEIGQFVLDHLEHNLESFLWAIDTLEHGKTLLQKQELLLSDLPIFFKRERWDIFDMAHEFNKNPKKFIVEILRREDLDFNFLRSTFAFMQTHILKIIYPEEILKKAKNSKYEEEIIKTSRSISKIELLQYLKLFSEAEIMAKLQDPFLIDKIRSQIFLTTQ